MVDPKIERNHGENWKFRNLNENIAIATTLEDEGGNTINPQHPLPTDGDSVYAKDIDVANSDNGGFSGSVTNYFDDLQTINTDSSATNPKTIIIQFKRSTSFYFMALGCNDVTKSFSNTKITIYGSAGAVRHTIDNSADNTKRNSLTFSLSAAGTQTGGNSMKIEFHTADEVCLSNILIFKTINVNSKILATSKLTQEVENIFSVGGALATVQESLSTKPIDSYLSQVVGSPKTLASNTIVGSYDIVVTAGHGLSANDEILITEDGSNPRSYVGKIISVVTNTLTMDTPIDTVFTSAGAVVFQTIKEMNVDGSSVASNFNITNGAEVDLHITRIIIHITDGTAMDDATFGGISALTRGIIFRQKFADGTYNNIFNVKTNGEFGELAYDKNYDDKAPAGVYGVTIRFTFGSLEKHGTILKIKENEALELLIQDDLTDLTSFRIMAEGHFGLPPL